MLGLSIAWSNIDLKKGQGGADFSLAFVVSFYTLSYASHNFLRPKSFPNNCGDIKSVGLRP